MKKLHIGTNMALFLLFFGMSLFEAFQAKNWLGGIAFSLMGIFFLYADNVKKKM